jgi:hypothetical protein
VTVPWKDPGLMGSHMGFVLSKVNASGRSEHSRMENYMEDHAGCRIMMDRERHTNPCAMDNQLVSRECITGTSRIAL